MFDTVNKICHSGAVEQEVCSIKSTPHEPQFSVPYSRHYSQQNQHSDSTNSDAGLEKQQRSWTTQSASLSHSRSNLGPVLARSTAYWRREWDAPALEGYNSAWPDFQACYLHRIALESQTTTATRDRNLNLEVTARALIYILSENKSANVLQF